MPNNHHVITYTEARDFILEFVTQYPDVASQSFGGFMDKTTVNNLLAKNGTTDLFGLLSYYCFNYEEIQEMPYFFLSFTNMEDFDTGNPPSQVPNSEFYRPSSVYAYTDSATEAAVKDYLEQTDFSQSGNAVSISRTNVIARNTEYMQNFPLADDNESYRNGPGGFFIQEGTGISDLLNYEGCLGMNYFFGINDDAEPKICMVLFPVDDEGKNIINQLIMERSWPI